VCALHSGFAQRALYALTELNQLLSSTLVSHPALPGMIWAPIRGLLPVPALTGAALLTFARIIRLGAAMDDEIKGTV
jgi:hypothetical protein